MILIRQQLWGAMPPELAIAQFVASVALTLASITVAIVSAIFAYRNNFGWKPIALTTSFGVSTVIGETTTVKRSVCFEIWNRRKYPIVVRSMRAEYTDITIDPSVSNQGDWLVTETWAVNGEQHTIAPRSHEKHILAFPFTAPFLDDMNAPVTITIRYFDPRANDIRSIEIEKLYMFHSNRKGDSTPLSPPLSPG